MSSPESQDHNGKTNAPAPQSPNKLEAIRDIIFGEQIAVYEEQFNALQQQMLEQKQALEQKINELQQKLEHDLGEHIKAAGEDRQLIKDQYTSRKQLGELLIKLGMDLTKD